MLPVYFSQTPLQALDREALPWIPFECDWFGAASTLRPQFRVIVTKHTLLFEALGPQPASYREIHLAGSFQPGLWEMDVAELFLCHSSGTGYREFNLAPSGAYWTAKFSDYRSIDETPDELPDEGPCALSHFHDRSWHAELLIPRDALEGDIVFDHSLRANVNFILGQAPRNFFSWEKLSAKEPDFHLCREFQSVERRPVA